MPMPLNRREFVHLGIAGLAAVGHGAMAQEAGAGDAGSGPAAADAVLEPARTVPVVAAADVVVAGAGPAGIAAALAAARAGARVCLLEAGGCLGGVWTAGLLSWILDAGNKRGIVPEIIARLRQRGSGQSFSRSVAYAPELMKIVLEELCAEAGVRVRLHTRVAAAGVADGRLRWVATESPSGREAWRAAAFVDATGDGDLAARAGCAFDYGDDRRGQAQPMSLLCMVAGLDPVAVTPFVRGLAEPAGHPDPKTTLLGEFARAGVQPSYTRPTIFHVGPDLFCFMINHQYGVRGFHADDVTAATLQARAEVHRLVDALRRLGPPWDDMRIVATAEHIGVREGRRIQGVYRLTADDLRTGAVFEDAVCRCAFGLDVHATDPAKSKGIPSAAFRAKPYDIPYRALVARDVSGLLVAGRCLSGDFLAHSSYRVTGDAAATGEAAGVAAALAARRDEVPGTLPWPILREALVASGALPG